MDPVQLASSEASRSGSTVFLKKGISGFGRTRVNTILYFWSIRISDPTVFKLLSALCTYLSSLKGHELNILRSIEWLFIRISKFSSYSFQNNKHNMCIFLWLFCPLFKTVFNWPCRAVGSESDCRSRGRELDPGPVQYFR